MRENSTESLTKSNGEIWEMLERGELPSDQETQQIITATPCQTEEFTRLVERLRFCHSIAVMKGEAEKDPFGYLLERQDWPNTRDKLEIALGCVGLADIDGKATALNSA